MNVTSDKIYQTAFDLLGTDASPKGLASDELGCAETVSDILFDAGCKIPVLVSTTELKHFLLVSKDWLRVSESAPGDVIISPTGEGGKNGISHGHTGIVMKDGKIASNDSATGLFKENYTLKSWEARYKVKGGYPIYFFRLADQVSPETARVVEEGLKVASEALKHPELVPASRNLLSALWEFIKKLTT